MLNQIDLSRIDLNLLVLFEIVFQERHVGRSAERLHLSPSAISHGLGRLRTLLGDPLFLKTPKGVVPTERALQLAPSLAEILARIPRDRFVGYAVRSAAFDAPLSSLARPIGVSSVILPSLLETLREVAPGVDLGIRQLLPVQGFTAPHLGVEGCVEGARRPDEWISRSFLSTIFRPVSTNRSSTRKSSSSPCERDIRSSATRPSSATARWSISSFRIPAMSPVSWMLRSRKKALTRRVALTVPNFIFALSVLAETEMVSALPKRFVEIHGARFNVVAVKAPLPLPRSRSISCFRKWR
jgi:DNA-binding transcriptional LysR family regulator